MTVVVGVAAPDGMILAAESRSTYTNGAHHRIASDNAQKVFQGPRLDRSRDLWASGIGQRTIAGLMDEFVSQLHDEVPQEAGALAHALGGFFDERYRAGTPREEVDTWEAAEGSPLGFLVAGYDDDGIGRIREVLIPVPSSRTNPEASRSTRQSWECRGAVRPMSSVA